MQLIKANDKIEEEHHEILFLYKADRSRYKKLSRLLIHVEAWEDGRIDMAIGTPGLLKLMTHSHSHYRWQRKRVW